MLICPICGGAMKEVMHFTAEKNYKTKQCKTCHFETKPHRLKLDVKSKDINIFLLSVLLFSFNQ